MTLKFQRLCYGAHFGAQRTKKVQMSLELSKKPQIKHLVYCLDEMTGAHLDESLMQKEIVERAIHTVMVVKKISPRSHPGFPKAFGENF